MRRYFGQTITRDGNAFTCEIDAKTIGSELNGMRAVSGVATILRAGSERELQTLIRLHMGL